jgi:hypothetical protein
MCTRLDVMTLASHPEMSSKVICPQPYFPISGSVWLYQISPLELEPQYLRTQQKTLARLAR